MRVFLLLSLSFSLCGMDEPDLTLAQKNFEIFESLKEHKDIQCVVFGLLQPNSVNGLRKTCRENSKIFSFCNPSIEFLSCNNKNIFTRDLKCIFLTAIFDARQDVVTCFAHNTVIASLYEITGTSNALYPYFLTHNEAIYLPIKHLKNKFLENPHKTPVLGDKTLLIACLSRNSERVRQVVTNPNIFLDQYIIERALKIIRDGDDAKTFTEMCKNEKICAYIQSKKTYLILDAFFYLREKYCEALILCKLGDINQKIDSYTVLDDFLASEKIYEEYWGKQLVGYFKKILIETFVLGTCVLFYCT